MTLYDGRGGERSVTRDCGGEGGGIKREKLEKKSQTLMMMMTGEQTVNKKRPI